MILQGTVEGGKRKDKEEMNRQHPRGNFPFNWHIQENVGEPRQQELLGSSSYAPIYIYNGKCMILAGMFLVQYIIFYIINTMWHLADGY